MLEAGLYDVMEDDTWWDWIWGGYKHTQLLEIEKKYRDIPGPEHGTLTSEANDEMREALAINVQPKMLKELEETDWTKESFMEFLHWKDSWGATMTRDELPRIDREVGNTLLEDAATKIFNKLDKEQ